MFFGSKQVIAHKLSNSHGPTYFRNALTGDQLSNDSFVHLLSNIPIPLE